MKVKKTDDEIKKDSSNTKKHTIINDYNQYVKDDNHHRHRHRHNHNHNHNQDDDDDEPDDDIDEHFLFETINDVKYIFINHFNSTSRTIAEFIDDDQITKLISMFVKI